MIKHGRSDRCVHGMKGAEQSSDRLKPTAWTPCSAIPAARSCRCTTRCSDGHSAHPHAPRAGGGAGRDGYARVTGGRRLHRHIGPGRDQPRHRHRGRFLDSVPLVAITGQVATPLIGTDAFQEVDIFGITMPIVKHSFLVRTLEDICRSCRTKRSASRQRPARAGADRPAEGHRKRRVRIHRASARQLRSIADPRCAERTRLEQRARADRARATPGRLRRRRRRHRPTRSTHSGHSCDATGIPRSHHAEGPRRAAGRRSARSSACSACTASKCANLAVQECDLLIVVGARFDDRATGKLAEFAPHAKVIHLDIDPSEVGKLRRADVAHHRRPEGRRCRALHVRPSIDLAKRTAHALRDAARVALRCAGPMTSMRRALLATDRWRRPTGDVYVSCDVGQHQMWVAQHCRFTRPRAPADQRRPGHDGLRSAGGDRRAARLTATRPSSASAATARS